MTTTLSPCPVCGALNAGSARFCSTCGTELASRRIEEVRKVVTILFADVTGSTALGERLDPEAMRTIMARYFAMMKRVIERHGGTVEKFIGDAVMAVFGIPVVHEDDALRAVRAAAEIKAELATLNAELLANRGIAIRFRTGVNTGEVVAGDPTAAANLVTGDTVNTAARLEQNAPPDEVYLGRLTYQLVRDAVEAEPVEPIAAKGKAEPVAAYRLVAVREGAAGRERNLERRLVGRERELNRLRRSLDDAIADERAVLFTLLGAAGIGKSRLVYEFVSTIGDRATVLKGRCLPYGEGITYWPIGEIVRAAAGITEADDQSSALTKLRGSMAQEGEGAEIAETLATAIGLLAGVAAGPDVFRAFRRFVESAATTQPVVVIFDDIQWAEPTLLDLIEHLVDWSRGWPVLALAIARPEFMDQRPGWAGGKLNAQTVLLEPLGGDATGELARSLLGNEVDPALVERVEAVAEGNPLFVEQFVAMLVEDGLVHRVGDRWQPTADLSAVAVPPTISALLAARLDRLPRHDRGVAERASVVGRIFERPAIAELSPESERSEIPDRLQNLVRAELIRPETSPGEIEASFRFRHILIRDAAYESLPKRERADLHARFAAWLERTSADRLAEYEEILAYHLDQAARYRSELGLEDDETDRLRGAATEHFEEAGERAVNRGDAVGGIQLLSRAAELARAAGRSPVRALLAKGSALRELRRAGERRTVAAEAEAAAIEFSDEVGRQRARVQQADATVWIDPEGRIADLRRVLDEALPVLEAANDRRGLAEAWLAVGTAGLAASRYADALAAYERARDYALGGGVSALADIAASAMAQAMTWGPTPAAQGVERADELMRAAKTRRGRALIGIDRAILLGLLGRFDEATADLEDARRTAEEISGGKAVWSNMGDSEIPRARGDWNRAIELLETGRANLQGVGDTGGQSTVEGLLSIVLAMAGRDSEALEMSNESERHASSDDSASHIRLQTGRSLALGHLGRIDEALEASARAVEIGRQTDYLNGHAEALEAQAEVLRLAGRDGEAKTALEEAIELYRRKENLAVLARLGVDAR